MPSSVFDFSLLSQILTSAERKASEAGATIAGGHTVTGDALLYGQSVTGVVPPDGVWRKNRLVVGDRLLLTKPIGTGILVAGVRAEQVSDDCFAPALESMQRLNMAATSVLREYPTVTAVTDISGFGLGGHIAEMAMQSGVSLEVDHREVPFFEGCFELAERGFHTRLTDQVSAVFRRQVVFQSSVPASVSHLFFDPQTSGGLVAGIPDHEADQIVQAMRAAGDDNATLIGRVTAASPEGLVTVV